jgi:hypothetical protein
MKKKVTKFLDSLVERLSAMAEGRLDGKAVPVGHYLLLIFVILSLYPAAHGPERDAPLGCGGDGTCAARSCDREGRGGEI